MSALVLLEDAPWRTDAPGQLTDPGYRGHVPLMATPPTVDVANNIVNGATTVATPKTQSGSYTSILPEDTTAYLPLGVGAAVPARGTSAAGALGAYAAQWPLASVGAYQVVRPEFMFDGTVFGFTLRQFNGVQYRIMVDGAYVTQYPQSLGGAANSYGEVRVTFATRAVRRIQLELVLSGPGFLGITHQVNDTIRATSPAKSRLVVAGDSYAGGTYSSAIGTFVPYLAQALGFRDYVNAGIGSTGWITPGTYTSMVTRLATDVIAHNPTDVVFTLGHNDSAQTAAAVTAGVRQVLLATRAALPKLRSLVVTGPLFAGGTGGGYAATAAAIQAGTVGLVDAYVDTIAVPVFTGTGKAGATTGTGNSDLYIGADGTHPTDAGAVWLGRVLAQQITAALS